MLRLRPRPETRRAIQELPTRFVQRLAGNAVVFTDTMTGREVRVDALDASGVCQFIRDMFGEKKTNVEG